MVDNVVQDLTIKPGEARNGTKKTIFRKGKKLEVTIPAGVKNGTLVKLSGALQITDGYYGDLYIQIHIKNRAGIIVLASAVTLVLIIIIVIAVTSNPPTIPAGDQASVSTFPGVEKSTHTLLPDEDSSLFVPDSTNSTVYKGYLTVLFNKQPNDVFSNMGKPVSLVNNESAVDPTWKELKAFLILDTTDKKPYIKNFFECASFAEEVHNNAEARGIRSAYVALIFSEEFTGHAVNAFHTTDKGMVYIDCSVGADSVSYIEEQQEYGIVPIQMAISFDYDFYKQYRRINEEIYDLLLETPGIVDLVFIYW
jgi:hypothetical protein